MMGVKGARCFNFIFTFRDSIHKDGREGVYAEQNNLGPLWGPETNDLQGLPKLARAQTASRA
jgi:hypothetical protein